MEGMPSGTGLSILGSGQLQLDTGTQSELEEEAAADQQRRDKELQKLLTNAFDDLYDDNDDQSTLSSIPVSEHNSNDGDNEDNQADNIAERYHAALFSNTDQGPQYILESGEEARRYHYPSEVVASNATGDMESYMNRINLVDTMSHQHETQGAGGDSTSVSALHYQHCFRTSPGGRGSTDVPTHDDNERYRQTGLGSMEQLQVLYEVRVREVARLTQQLELQAQEAAREKDDLHRQVAFREAEKERAKMLYQQAQELLVESKGKIADLEKHVSSLEATVKSLEKTKADLSEKLEASKESVEDLHQKITLLERGSLNNTDKHLDAFLRNVQKMHSQQIKKLEDELALAVSKLSAKESELEQQKQDAIKRQQQLEARLAEKGDTVNQMARSLEEAQRQCQNLMTQGAAQEVAHLRLKLGATESECKALTERMQISQREMDALRVELKQYESVLKEELLQEAPDGTSDPLLAMGLSGNSDGQLRNELQRALLGQKIKRNEIASLTKQLESFSQELAGLKDKEKHYNTRIEQLETKCVSQQEEIQRHQQSLTETRLLLNEKENLILQLRGKLNTMQENSFAQAEAELAEKTQALLEAKEQCQKLKEELVSLKKREENPLRDYSGEYLRFHEQKLAQALEERNRVHKGELETVRAELEQARKEGDGVKELYINVCHSKDELVTALQKEQNQVKELQAQIMHLQAEQQATGHILQASSSRVHTDLQALKGQLLSEKMKVEELQSQNKLLLEKLEKGKDNLEAAQKAVTEIAGLQAELVAQKCQLKDLEEHYEGKLKQISLEKEQALQEAENRSKNFYTAKVTEEIEKAKTDALIDLKKNWQENNGDDTLVAKLKQLEEDHMVLEQQLEAAVQRHAQDTATLSHHLEKAKSREAVLCQELAVKDEELNKLKQTSESDEISGSSSIEKVKKEMMGAFAAKLQSVQTQHQLQLEETCERVKDETVRFCVQQIRQTEEKYLASIKKCKEAYATEMEKLRSALADTETKLATTTETLRETKTILEKERSVKGNDKELKTKVLALENQLKNVALKAEKTEKTLESTKAKYHAAKKAVYKYKKFIEAQQKHMEKEWERINVGYQQTLNEVQQKLTKLVCCKDDDTCNNTL
ncbi:hypothetical protein R5R35_005391 [Gryllus longicercus]|uniref:Uncharacterized protein n=1 Tax=Gryllus longicercus TaxID=2509291 RepID=A0AAN9VIU0_9ORTH